MPVFSIGLKKQILEEKQFTIEFPLYLDYNYSDDSVEIHRTITKVKEDLSYIVVKKFKIWCSEEIEYQITKGKYHSLSDVSEYFANTDYSYTAYSFNYKNSSSDFKDIINEINSLLKE